MDNAVEKALLDFRRRMVAQSEEPELHKLLGNAIDALAHSRSEVERMREVLLAYEKWEADMILCDAVWQTREVPLPVITQELWDRFVEIQGMRNAALSPQPPKGDAT